MASITGGRDGVNRAKNAVEVMVLSDLAAICMKLLKVPPFPSDCASRPANSYRNLNGLFQSATKVMPLCILELRTC